MEIKKCPSYEIMTVKMLCRGASRVEGWLAPIGIGIVWVIATRITIYGP